MKTYIQKYLYRTSIFALAAALLLGGMHTFAANDNASNGRSNCPPGHLVAPGWLTFHEAPDLDSCGDLPHGIFKKIFSSNPFHDMTAPHIMFLYPSDKTENSVVINIITNEPAMVKVAYGTDMEDPLTQATDSFSRFSHIVLSDLDPETTYHYQIVVVDRGGNERISDERTFTTLASDTEGAVISDISVSDLSKNSATISWKTDEPTTSILRYGTSSTYGKEAADTDHETVHSMTLTDLDPDTTYHFRIFARDEENNLSSSADKTFSTPAENDTTGPVISAILVDNITTSGAEISWKTDESSKSILRFGKTTSYGSSLTDGFDKEHSLAITGLSDNTLYHFKIVATDSSGNETSSADMTFTTKDAIDSVGPVISSISTEDITGLSATVTWVTNESATSTLYWSTTSPVDKATASKMSVLTLGTNHAITMTNLSVGTTYYFLIEAEDSSGNMTTSGQGTLTTAL